MKMSTSFTCVVIFARASNRDEQPFVLTFARNVTLKVYNSKYLSQRFRD
jgi:hypothetical protein